MNNTIAKQPESTLDSMQKSIDEEKSKRRMIAEFVKSELREDVDFGRIKLKNGAETKPCLFKAGMEKIFSLFSVTSELSKDEETLSMISTKDLIAYKCKLYRNNQCIGEGRGACAVSEKGRVNDAIKIAEKRARMDACLNLGFSEYFTQDLEDRAAEDGKVTAPQAAAPQGATHAGEALSMKNGEIRELEFFVQGIELKTAQSGTTYAVLSTDLGQIKAWKNSYPKIKEGATYLADVEASTWNNRVSLAVVRLHQAIPREEYESEESTYQDAF